MADNEDPKINAAAESKLKPVEAKQETKADVAGAPKPVPLSKADVPTAAIGTKPPLAEPKMPEAAKVSIPVTSAMAPVTVPDVAATPKAKGAGAGKAPVMKAKRGSSVDPFAKAAPPKPKPVASAPTAAAPAKVKPALTVSAPAVSAKTSAVKPAVKVAKGASGTAPAIPGPKAATPNATTKIASAPASHTDAGKPVFAGLFSNFMLEETTMNASANFTGFQDAVSQAQAKAKAAFDKGTSVLGEVSDFAKGNVEAAVESGKIYAEGVQALGSEMVAEGRTAFETMTGDLKELAAAKSPTDFFKLQSDLFRKNFDTAVAYSSKNSEAMLKLFNDTFAPISGRVSLAVEKARTAASTATTPSF